MTDTIVAAIIGAGATLFAPLIPFLVHGTIKSRSIHTFKKGYKFSGTWSNRNGTEYKDEITVESTWRGRIKCTGTVNYNGKIKHYSLIGRKYNYCITFEFLGLEDGQHDETAGVIIFKKDPNNTQIAGTWSQLNIDGELIGGTVEWLKI